MALPNTDLTKSMLNKSAFVDGDPDAQAYDKRPAHHKATMDDDPRGGGPASGVMTLKQRLAARKEQVTGVRQAAAHAHYTEPEQDKEPKFQKVNLIGSMMNEHAVFSLVTQTDDITYMDLRGNGLDSAFGWKLIKAMKKQYLRLDFCNGINTKRIRENSIDDLNLTGFLSHNGLFGIEPVGAIFLAHFLRGNTSLVSIQFQRNSVGKDGSKAIAQAIIGNPDSQINEVNHMKPKKKRGVNFTKFQSKEIEEIRMANFNLVDEDIVFLEEYLSRHDCVKELDLKGNPFFGEGVRKLGRYLGVSQTLEVLRLNNVPVSLEGIQLLTKGISANQSLTWIAFPIGIAYGPSKELLQVMHQLAVALSRHPKMERWGSTPVRCDYVKNNEMGEYNMMRLLNTGYHYDVALFFWILATCKPSTKTDIEWNPVKGEGQEYPQVKPYSPALFLAISSACHQLRGHLTEITIAIAKDMTGVAQLLYYMAGSDTLKKVSLPAFANAKISFEELPKEWHDEGQLPLWFREYLTKQRRLWDALWGFVQRTKNLEQFNAVNIKDFEGDAIEFQVMLMFECQRDFVAVRESNQEISLHYGNHCEPEFPFQATRLLNPKKKYTINIEFVGKNQALIKEQQDAIALLIVAKGDGATGGPTFPQYPHNVRCRNQTTSKQLINSMEYSACLQEIYIESVETVLSVLVKSLCTPKSRENLKAIKINRFWYPSRKMPKQYSGKQIERLKMLQDWMKGSSHFTGVSSTILGDLDKQQLAKMDLHEFGDALSGLRIEEMQVQPIYQPSVAYEIFHDVYDYFYPPEEDEAEDGGPKDVWFLLPLHESFPGKFLKTIHLTNANIKKDILKMYPDQYAESSKKLWLHKNCHKKLAGDVTAMHQADGMDYDYEDFIRFHWDKDVSLGTGYNAEALSKTYLTEQRKHSKGFHNDVLMLMLKSLMESPALTDLDLRGNNFEGDDVRIIIKMLPESSLLVLNAIPLSDEGGEATELRFEAGPIELPESPDDRPEIDEYADPDYAATMSACQAWRGVRLDEGDCAIFQHLVSPKRFPNLQRIVFIKHTINESAMQFLCDALIHLKKLAEFSMVECIMSNRASSLLVHTLADLGNHLHIINDVGFGKKMSNRESAPTWVDANLGVIGRKNAWSDLSFGNSNTKDFLVERSLSDSGLRGLSSYIRFAAGSKVSQQLAEHIPKLRKVDFSYNHIVSDAVIAEFCRSLLMPGAAPDLGEIDCRYCTSLKARSAFELHHLVQRDSDHNQGSCPRLHTINGMNVKLLIMAAQDGKATAPLVIRMHAGALEDMNSETRAPKLLSESDTHFFAHCLHMFPNIPHCHLHMMVTQGEMEEPLKNYRIPGFRTGRSNVSPFIKPTKVESYYNRQFEICESFFQACPVSTRLQLSISPKPDIYYFKEAIGQDLPGDDLVLLPPVSGSKNAAKSDSIFGATVRGILRAKQRRRKKAAEEDGEDALPPRPKKPMYVNNINSQRLHNQYRSLYGFDDVDILEEDIHNDTYSKHRVLIPPDVDLSNLFSVVSSLDIQWCALTKHHIEALFSSIQNKDLDLGMLTHLNLNNNQLFDHGVSRLMEAFAHAGTTIVHLTVAGNSICCDGAKAIAQNLYAMQRLTSLCVANNGIRETGAIYLANAIGGRKEGEFIPLLSMDFTNNHCRELGAERWAKVLIKHQTLQFFNYAQNDLAYTQNTYFLALIFACMQSPALAVLDLSNNFQDSAGQPADPPEDILEALAGDIPDGVFDSKEVAKGIFIRRNKK